MDTLKSSETTLVNRSDINFNPKNIKEHDDAAIRKQLKNFKRIGVLGGIVWNERTGNLIDGQRRLMALDKFNNYNPDDPSTDYSIKVEVVDFDDKTEKEQMVFMAAANTKPDFKLLASVIDDVDYDNIGISMDEYKEVLSLRDVDVEIPTIQEPIFKEEHREQKGTDVTQSEEREEHSVQEKGTDGTQHTEEKEQKGTEEQTEQKKKELVQVMSETPMLSNNDEPIRPIGEKPKQVLTGVIRFADEEEKERFCTMFSIFGDNVFINASDILERIL